MNTLVTLLRLMRVHASVAAVLGVLVVAVLLDETLLSAPVLVASLAVFLITGAGNALNDCYDREIDRINRPTRPVASGAISVRAALAFSWLLFGSGIAASLWLGIPCLAVAVVNAGLLIAYAKYSKQWGLAKNLVVSYLVGSLFLFASLAVQAITLMVAILGTCAFLATLAREIMKDVEDAGGDLAGNSRTLPIMLGATRARHVASAALVVSVALALVPWALQIMHGQSLLLVLAGAGIFARGYRLDAAVFQRYIMAGSLVELCAFWVAK